MVYASTKEGGTNDASGKPHIAEVEFNRRYGDQVAMWFEQYRDRNLAHYYEILTSRASAGNSQAQRLDSLRNHPHASAILKCMSAYDELQTRFHQAHLGLAIQQLKIVGADVGTGGTSFRDYLAKYHKSMGA